MDQAHQLLDLIRTDDLQPVLVLDDTDKWLNTTWQPGAATVQATFFGRVILWVPKTQSKPNTVQLEIRIAWAGARSG
jgi:hypothetical protein